MDHGGDNPGSHNLQFIAICERKPVSIPARATQGRIMDVGRETLTPWADSKRPDGVDNHSQCRQVGIILTLPPIGILRQLAHQDGRAFSIHRVNRQNQQQ